MLTHENASPAEWTPYLSLEFAPLVPLVMWGRAATNVPAVPVQHAVYYFWKDVAWTFYAIPVHSIMVVDCIAFVG